MRVVCSPRLPALLLLGVLTAASSAWGETTPKIMAPPVPAATQPAGRALDSPRSTMLTFLGAMQHVNEGNETTWPIAVSTLDLSETGENPHDLADDLLAVLDRLGEVREAELPNAEAVERQGLTRFKYFPRRDQHAWVWKALGHEPEGDVVLERGPAGEWRFSARTVARLGKLYESMKAMPPRYVAQSNEIATLLGPTFSRTPWWGWAALLGMIFLGVLAGRLVQGFLRAAVERGDPEQRRFRRTVMHDAVGPLGLAVVAVGLTAGLRFVHIEPEVGRLLSGALKFLYLLATGWLLFNLVDVIDLTLRRLTAVTDTRLDDMLVPLIRKSLRIFLLVVFTLGIAQNVFGLDITGWLAGLGIAGLAVSLAAQDSVKNLFGSITVFFDKPFGVGDAIKFSGHDGAVEEIGFRSTKLRTAEGNLVTIPNMKFIDSSVENISARGLARRVLEIQLSYDTPLPKIEEALTLLRGVLAEPEIAAGFDPEKNPPKAALIDLKAAGPTLQVLYWFAKPRDYWAYVDHAERFNLRVLRAFTEAGIGFGTPGQTLHLAAGTERERLTATRGVGGHNGNGRGYAHAPVS